MADTSDAVPKEKQDGTIVDQLKDTVSKGADAVVAAKDKVTSSEPDTVTGSVAEELEGRKENNGPAEEKGAAGGAGLAGAIAGNIETAGDKAADVATKAAAEVGGQPEEALGTADPSTLEAPTDVADEPTVEDPKEANGVEKVLADAPDSKRQKTDDA